MCVVSMVYDHYSPFFAFVPNSFPGDPHPFTGPHKKSEPGPEGFVLWAPEYTSDILQNFPRPQEPFDVQSALDGLSKHIDDFRAALKAARIVDVLTDQPDCEDPEKAKLEVRVKELEDALATIRNVAKVSQG